MLIKFASIGWVALLRRHSQGNRHSSADKNIRKNLRHLRTMLLIGRNAWCRR